MTIRSGRLVRACRVLAGLVVLTVILVTAGCDRREGPGDAVRIGRIPWPGHAIIYAADELGYFEERGVNVEIVKFESNAEVRDALQSGVIDAIYTLVPDVVIMEQEGRSPVIIAIADYSVSGDVIVARTGITTPADLRGRTVAFEGINSFSHLFVLELLRSAGLREGDVFLRNVSANDVPRAIAAGEIDAGHVWEPILAEAIAAGYHVIATAADTPAFIIDVLVTTPDVVAKRRGEIVALVGGLNEAVTYLQGPDHTRAVKMMAEADGMSVTVMEQGLQALRIPTGEEALQAMRDPLSEGSLSKAFEIVQNIYLGRGQLTRIPKSDEMVDSTILAEAMGR